MRLRLTKGDMFMMILSWLGETLFDAGASRRRQELELMREDLQKLRENAEQLRIRGRVVRQQMVKALAQCEPLK